MSKFLKKISAKTMTRAGTTFVALLASAILLLTMWFIMETLGEVAVAQTSNGAKQLRIEGVSTPLLEKAMTFKDEKTADDRKLAPGLPNPFSRPPSQPQPTTPPAPETTPTPTPEPAPAPAQ